MIASAPPTLQTTGGVILKTGTAITGTGSNIILTSSTLGEITCQKPTLTGTLSLNDTTNGITGTNHLGEEEPSTTNCKNGTNSVIVTRVKLSDVQSAIGGSALASLTAVIDVATRACTFTGTAVSGSYVNGGNVLTFTSATGISSTPAACGTAKLDGAFTLEQGNGDALKAVF